MSHHSSVFVLLTAMTSCDAPAAPAPAVGRILEQDVTSSSIDTNAKTALDGLDLDQIVEFRLRRVRELGDLGIFPASYHPLQGPSWRIYQPITPKARWLGPTPYYLANPHVLIVVTSANHMTPLNLLCPDVSLRLDGAVIEERHTGAAAQCWFRWLYEGSYAEHPGVARLVMVNAYDAGLRYAHVDRERSVNVRDEGAPDNVVRGFFSQSSVFQFGKYQANNISPEDPRGWVRLERQSVGTRIYVKLWREAPVDAAQKPDFVYDVVVEP